MSVEYKLRCFDRFNQSKAALMTKALIGGLLAPAGGFLIDSYFAPGGYYWTAIGVAGLFAALAYHSGIEAAVELMPNDSDIILDVLCQVKDEPKA